MANRLGDSRSKAYAMAGEIIASTFFAPKSLGEFEILKGNAIRAASDTADAFIRNWTWWVIGWDEMNRGRMNQGRDAARELMQVGQLLNDPRSTGFGLNLLSWIALTLDSYGEALEHADQSLSVAVTPWDRISASLAKGSALMVLQRTEEAANILQEQRDRITRDGDFTCLVPIEPMLGVYKVLNGSIAEGFRLIEEAILRREKDGYRGAASWYRAILAEAYLEIVAGNERPPLPILLKNLLFLSKTMVTASSQIRALLTQVLDNEQIHPNGFYAGKSEMLLGLLYKAKKKRALALRHLTKAERILSQFGQTPVLARVETALSQLER
jgi:tetratricopeptide (TPR) repeat protein